MMLSVLLLSLAAGQAFKWARVFATPNASYTWIARKDDNEDGGYGAPTMKLLAVGMTGTWSEKYDMFEKQEKFDCLMYCHEYGDYNFTSSDQDLSALKWTASKTMFGDCTAVAAGGTITPSVAGASLECFTLTFDDAAEETTFTVDASSATNIVFFAQHGHYDGMLQCSFCRDTKHIFQTPAGADVEPYEDLSQRLGGLFGWMGIFATPDPVAHFAVHKVNGAYAKDPDGKMALVALPADAATGAALDALVDSAKDVFARGSRVRLQDCVNIVSDSLLATADRMQYYSDVSQYGTPQVPIDPANHAKQDEYE